MTDYGLFTIDKAARTARGYLLPFGVKSKGTSSSNTRPITFPRENVAIPRDPSVVSLNLEHGRFDVLGRAIALEPDDTGILATFALADTDEADAWIAEHAGTGAYFSAEIANLTRAPGDIGAGRLAGAAVTTTPAFDGTGVALFSLLGEETELEDETAADEADPDDAPAAPDTEPDTEPDDEQEEAVAEATVGTPAQFSRKPSASAPARLSKAGFFSAFKQYRQTADLSALRPYMDTMTDGEAGMFALTDVKYDGAGGLAADAGIPDNWLGELWQGASVPRKIVPLLTQATLTGIKASGWIWTTKPAMASWAGNKADIPSNAPVVAPKDFYSVKFAGGHDLAREYYDFGVTEIIDSYAQAMVDSYASLSDGYALTTLLAGASTFTPIAATANKGLSAVIDGILAVAQANAEASFGVVAPNVWRDIFGIQQSAQPAYGGVSAGMLEATVLGVPIIADGRLAAGQVLIGARQAATAWELPGVPIRVSAPDLVKGGVDNAFFGYIGVGVTYPAAIVKATVTLPLAEIEVAEPEEVAASKGK